MCARVCVCVYVCSCCVCVCVVCEGLIFIQRELPQSITSPCVVLWSSDPTLMNIMLTCLPAFSMAWCLMLGRSFNIHDSFVMDQRGITYSFTLFFPVHCHQDNKKHHTLLKAHMCEYRVCVEMIKRGLHPVLCITCIVDPHSSPIQNPMAPISATSARHTPMGRPMM